MEIIIIIFYEIAVQDVLCVMCCVINFGMQSIVLVHYLEMFNLNCFHYPIKCGLVLSPYS